MIRTRTPATFLPGARDMRRLVAESPRYDLVLDTIRRGRATAREVAGLIWPNIDLDAVDPFLHMAPVDWVRLVLDSEARSCAGGGSGMLYREGDDYIADPEHADGARPPGLPEWKRS